MLFSIIIPTYNRSKFLKQLLSQILDQIFSDLEIVVVDDGSTDNTGKIVAAFSDPRLIYCCIKNSERGAARNYGLKVAKGTYINFFDSDDLFLPCLQDVANFISANNFPEVLFGNIQHVDEAGIVLPAGMPPYQSFTKNLLHNNFLACGSVFIRKEIALLFPFHEDRRLSSAEDWELWLRLHTQYPFMHFRHPIFKQVHHPDRSLFNLDPDRIEIRDVYFADLIKSNNLFREFYGDRAIGLFVADRYTFVALSWSQRDLSKSFFYWRKAVYASVMVVKRKRFWAVLKKMVFRF
jgi:glycosyltransferase involved in cell wall biosynthesis